MFSAVHAALANGGCIGIFPEGGSHDRTDLLPLKVSWAKASLGQILVFCVYFIFADCMCTAVTLNTPFTCDSFLFISISLHKNKGWRGGDRAGHSGEVRREGAHRAHWSDLLPWPPLPRTPGGGVRRAYLHYTGTVLLCCSHQRGADIPFLSELF